MFILYRLQTLFIYADRPCHYFRRVITILSESKMYKVISPGVYYINLVALPLILNQTCYETK